MSHLSHANVANRCLAVGIGVILALYLGAALRGLPQEGAALVAREKLDHLPKQGTGHEQTMEDSAKARPHDATTPHFQEAVRSADHAFPGDHPTYWMIVPFAVLLIAIACFPLIPSLSHWWESNLHRFYVAAGLGAITLVFYLAFYPGPIVGHWPAFHLVPPPENGLHWAGAFAVFANALLSEYIPFMVLLLSLYTISGGVRIEGDWAARPTTNTGFLAVGGLLASFVGTTGAAMLLIRPLLETNRQRKHTVHTVVFFIFVVCNCGGCLLPLGDPPLFLGYLQGVPFLWTLKLWPAWLFVNGMLLVVYYVWDRFWVCPREIARDMRREANRTHRIRIAGIGLHVPLLVGVVLSIGLLDPAKALPGLNWHPWLYLREIVQLTLVAVSLTFGNEHVRRANRFDYHAILEVAALFLGIFLCMQPALQILDVRGDSLGLASPSHFYWATGLLSSMLDNAPTYVVFFETARTLGGVVGEPMVCGVREPLLAAISLSAVFFGAMTYIGNGPNFMVKAIAEKEGVSMPTFFGYLAYSIAVLLPLFVATSLIFL
jgi:Na+/H+ antiporter NhaD/arsenite permease-like protein